MLEKFPSDKINVTKNAPFFLSRAPTLYSFIFHSRFLCELGDKVRLPKRMRGTFYFRFRSIFIKVNFFVQQKAWTL